jgi:hypothetical protein
MRTQLLTLLTLSGIALGLGCSAGNTDTTGSSSSTGGSSSSTGASGPGGGATTSQGGSTGSFTTGTGGTGDGGGGGIPMNLCGTECGPMEICDGIHKGLDDNCDGTIDEGCLCSAGQASSCFKGDPSYLDAPGCLPGTMYCTELGVWGPCTGGKHAVAPDNCQLSDPLGCHPINGVPFQTVDLYGGTGNFSMGGSAETFTVTCPTGVSPCPTPTNNTYQALQSGEYTVTYTRTVNGMVDSCTYPLYIGARGLRVELSWNHPTATDHVDLDLHLHQPMTTTSFSISGAPQDCGYGNCTAYAFDPTFPSPNSPQWFPSGNVPPAPVNWFNDTTTPNDAGNLCYFGPGGDSWASMGEGCHSPRLDLDNISCDATVTDPADSSFCTPENINVDFPPKDQWFRVGVHFYGQTSQAEDILPTVKIFCDGKLAGEVGAVGYHDPEAPFVWTAADEDKFWLVGDVLFKDDGCVKECVLQPLYSDAVQKTPFVENTSGSIFSQTAAFGPAYPPMP